MPVAVAMYVGMGEGVDMWVSGCGYVCGCLGVECAVMKGNVGMFLLMYTSGLKQYLLHIEGYIIKWVE